MSQLAVQSLFRTMRTSATSATSANTGSSSAGEGLPAVRAALGAAFDRAPKQAPYVRTLQLLALADDVAAGTEAQSAAAAARASGSLQAGALQVGSHNHGNAAHSLLHVRTEVSSFVRMHVRLWGWPSGNRK